MSHLLTFWVLFYKTGLVFLLYWSLVVFRRRKWQLEGRIGWEWRVISGKELRFLFDNNWLYSRYTLLLPLFCPFLYWLLQNLSIYGSLVVEPWPQNPLKFSKGIYCCYYRRLQTTHGTWICYMTCDTIQEMYLIDWMWILCNKMSTSLPEIFNLLKRFKYNEYLHKINDKPHYVYHKGGWGLVLSPFVYRKTLNLTFLVV